jgi:hypothetical protein
LSILQQGKTIFKGKIRTIMNKENKGIIFLSFLILFFASIAANTTEGVDPLLQPPGLGMGNIIIPNPPNLRLLQPVVEDLARQEEILSPPGYETIKTFLTNAPIFQAVTYAMPQKLLLFITDMAVGELTQEELYFIVGHELGHNHNTILDPANIDLQEEILADRKGLYALTHHLGGKDHLPKALKIILKFLDKIGFVNNGLNPCYQIHSGLLQEKEINDSIGARKNALQELSYKIQTGSFTNPLLEGIKIQEIGIEEEISDIEVKFYVTPVYIDKGHTYKKLVRLYKKEGKRWKAIWKYTETRVLKAEYTSFRTLLEYTTLSPGEYKVWIKLYVLDSKTESYPVAAAQARGFFVLE